jgi:ankyrin repeat protein
VDIAGRGGWTALGLASRAGHVAIVEALLEGGADPAAVVVNGKTALDIARLNQKGAIVALLESTACQVCD